MASLDTLVAAGTRTGEGYLNGGENARADHYRCSRCGADALKGLDGEVAAFSVVTEVHPLDARGEFVALMSGRATFTHRMLGKRMVLRYRTAGMIASQPPSAFRVLAEHHCGQPLGTPPPPPQPVPITFLDTGNFPPCQMCGLPSVTHPCSTCRRAAEPPRPIRIDKEES
jgi:hypothetical protein